MNDLVYAQFADGSIHHLKDAKIEYFPRQSLFHYAGANPCKGIFESSEPIEPYKLDKDYGIYSKGQGEYRLTFNNLANNKFREEDFWINSIKFFLIESNNGKCIAYGKE